LGDDPFSDIILILILTGQRRSEVGGLRWDEIDFSRNLITLGPARTKNKRSHELPISNQVRAILERQPRKGEYVWGKCWNGWSDGKRELDKRLNGMAEWHLHDLRRSCATMMADRLNVQPHIIESVLNHYSGHRAGVAGIYQRARYQDQMREALEMWGTYVERLSNSAE
jgi:integrase